jgi:hypothetical protein
MTNENENKPVVSTKVKIGGKEIELTNMPTATGLEIYRSLPADHQQQATQIAEVVTVFGSFLEVSKKYNLDPTELAQKFVAKAMNTDAAKTAKVTLSDVQEKAIGELKNLGIDAKSVVRMIPGMDTAMGVAKVAGTAADVVGVAGSAAVAAADGAIHGLPRMWNMLATLAKEGKGLVFGYGSGAPKDDALAFGAAVMAVRYQSLQERHAKPMVDMPFNGQESQLEAQPAAVTLAGWDAVKQWVKINMPIVIAAINWITSIGDKTATWDKLLAEANAQSAALKSGKAESFQQQVDRRAIGSDNAHAKTVIEAAEQVAGLNAKAVAGVATATTGPDLFGYRDTKGNDITVENGQVVAQVTPLDRIAGAYKEITGDGNPAMQALTAAGAVAGAGTVVNNGAKGLVRGLTAAVTSPSAATEKLMEWAHKPAQVGIGEHAWKTGAKSWINMPGKIAVGVGDVTGRATRWTVNGISYLAGAAKNFVVGGVEGVHAATNGANVGAATSKVEAASKFLSGTYTKYLPWAAPVASGSNMLADIGRGETSSAVIHGVETVGLGAAIKTVGIAGAARLSPYIAPVMSTTEGIIAAKNGDMIGVKKAGVELSTIGSFTTAGAGIGFLFGGVGAVPGAAIGATLGGIASLFSGKMYENHAKGKALVADAGDGQKTASPQPAGALGAPDKGLQAAAVDATRKAEQARLVQVAKDSPDAVRDIRMAAGRVFGQVSSVRLAQAGTGNVTPTGNLPHSSAAQASLPPMA